MLQTVDFTSQGIHCHFPQTISERDVSPLLAALDSANFDEFVKALDGLDLNQVYDHEKFPEPQLLSRFLLLRFLGFIEGDDHFPSGFPNAQEFIKAVLERKPDLTFCVDENYSFAEFVKDWRKMLIETIADLKANPEIDCGYVPQSVLLQSYEVELSQIELIANHLYPNDFKIWEYDKEAP